MPPSLEKLVLNLIFNGYVLQTHVEDIRENFQTEIGELQERIRTLEGQQSDGDA